MEDRKSQEYKDKKNAHRRGHWARDPVKHRALSRAWKLRNPEKCKEHKRRDYQKRKEAIRIKNKEWNAANRESQTLKKRDHYRRNREKIRAAVREVRLANIGAFKAKRQHYWRTKRWISLLSSARRACRQNGLAYDLTHDLVRARIEAGVCEMSGLPFDMDGKRTPNSPSIDRIDPVGGYTQDNCRVIIWWLNKAMSNLGDDYACMVFERVIEQRKIKQKLADEKVSTFLQAHLSLAA